MDYEQLLHQLDLPQQIICEMMALKELALSHEADALMLTNRSTAEKAYALLEEKLNKDPQAMLACQLLVAAKTYDRWLEKGFTREIFLDTMGCYRRFLGEALVKSGKLEFDRGWWTYRQLSMVLFRIGQLEFELNPKEKAISVHIPSDARITPENVDASLRSGREWIARLFPDYAEYPMTCDSWLLSPELGKLLKPDSNILAFQKRFRIVEVFPDAMDCLEWLFRVPNDTALQDLPEKTSLQRSVKEKLLSGGKIGIALGVLE